MIERARAACAQGAGLLDELLPIRVRLGVGKVSAWAHHSPSKPSAKVLFVAGPGRYLTGWNPLQELAWITLDSFPQPDKFEQSHVPGCFP